jgi:hypothetical protein
MGILREHEIDNFIHDGFVKIENAFSQRLAEQALDILWRDTGAERYNPSTWTKPVIRLGEYSHEPFRQIVNTSVLHNAFDQLVGAGNWLPRGSLGSFPVRFPSKEDPSDTGWHVDASYAGADPTDFFGWRINVRSKGRALLMLFLFTDVSERDAPTRIRKGSHLDVARILQPYGDDGLSFKELAEKLGVTAHCEEVSATGNQGTVYLCHPFLVHAAQPHHGTTPRFLAQPPLLTAKDFQLNREDENYSPVEMAIRKAYIHK